jgi:hypothetical protein
MMRSRIQSHVTVPQGLDPLLQIDAEESISPSLWGSKVLGIASLPCIVSIVD